MVPPSVGCSPSSFKTVGARWNRLPLPASDSSSIEPSPAGVPVRDGKRREHRFTGRVCEVVFDCFGDFEGFVLRDCRERRHFQSCEPTIRDLVLRACQQRLQLTVYVEEGADPEIRRIVVTCC